MNDRTNKKLIGWCKSYVKCILAAAGYVYPEYNRISAGSAYGKIKLACIVTAQICNTTGITGKLFTAGIINHCGAGNWVPGFIGKHRYFYLRVVYTCINDLN